MRAIHPNTAKGYYPFGMLTKTTNFQLGSFRSPEKHDSGLMDGRSYSISDYRWSFNGNENDMEIRARGNCFDYGFRIYNSSISRFLSVDPVSTSWGIPLPIDTNDKVARDKSDKSKPIKYLGEDLKMNEPNEIKSKSLGWICTEPISGTEVGTGVPIMAGNLNIVGKAELLAFANSINSLSGIKSLHIVTNNYVGKNTNNVKFYFADKTAKDANQACQTYLKEL